MSSDIELSDLWNPAFNEVWNEIAPFVIGKANRGDIPPCKYDELFLQGGRACVGGDTLIATPSGDVKIKDFSGGQIYCYDKDGNIVVAEGCAATRYRPEPMFRVTTEDGRSITCTAEHRFMTDCGWLSCSELREGDRLLELNCSCDTQSTSFLRSQKVSSCLRESYYGGHLSRSREDAIRSTRTLLGLIYRCSRDFRLCDEQLLSEADTFEDVLRLLVDAQEHIQHGSRADGVDSCDTGIRPCLYGLRPSSCGCHFQTSDIRCGDSESEISETLSELISGIYSASSQSQRSDTLSCKVREAASLLVSTMRCLDSQSEHRMESQILQVLCDTLKRSVADETYSDSFQNKDTLIGIHRDFTKYSRVVSIVSIGKTDFYDIFVPFYNNYIGNGIVNHNSGKSYFASVIVWLTLENDPQKNAVVIRKVASSLRKSCWKQMMKVRDRLGYYHWKPNKTELVFTNEKTGQQIFFVGLDDEEKVRSITVEKGYISIAWFEEAKQFANMEEIDQAVSSLLRGGAEDDNVSGDTCDESGDMEYMTILTYNPPKSNFDWINREAKMGDLKPTRLTHKSTYRTMPKKWLGAKVLNEIRIMEQTKPEQFRHMYLGEITGTGWEYFRNIQIRRITDEEIAGFEYFNMGIDWGYADPNVFVKTYIRDRVLYIFDEIYQKELPDDGSSKLDAFAKMVKKHIRNCPDEPIYCDAQGHDEAEILSGNPHNINIYTAPKQGVNGRIAGYKYLQNLLAIVIDKERCPHCAEEFLAFESKPRPGGGEPLDEPGTKGDHCPDAVRYSEWQNIRNSSHNESDLGELPSAVDDAADEDDLEVDLDMDDAVDFDDEDFV